MAAKPLRWLGELFRLSWVAKAPGNSIPCGYCGGNGRYDPLYGYGVKPGEDTVRTQDCPECTGLGYHFIPEDKNR